MFVVLLNLTPPITAQQVTLATPTAPRRSDVSHVYLETPHQICLQVYAGHGLQQATRREGGLLLPQGPVCPEGAS